MEKKDFSRMEAVVKRYVRAYKEDFAIDKGVLGQPTENRYLWLVRRCGTNLIPMSAVAHSDVVKHYLEARRDDLERANEIARFYEVDAKTLRFKAIRNVDKYYKQVCMQTCK